MSDKQNSTQPYSNLSQKDQNYIESFLRHMENAPAAEGKESVYRPSFAEKAESGLSFGALDLLRKYPEDLQFPNEIRKPHPKKRQGIQTAYRCNARPFS